MTILLFIAILVVLILVHEFGHFLVAKFFDIKVEEFGLGFPPRAVGIKRGETIYSVNWLPLGGFVRIFGEEGEGKKDPRSFASRPAWQRSLILVAGVTFNVIFAFFVLWIGFSTGFPTSLDDETVSGGTLIERNVQVVDIAQASPADEAGIQRGDGILRIKNQESRITEISTVETLQDFTNQNQGQVLALTIKRGDDILEKEVLARQNPPEGEGAMGVTLATIGLVKYPWYSALVKALEATVRNVGFVFVGFYLLVKALFVSGEVIGEVAGPVGIAVLTGQIYTLGLPYLLSFISLISINLAVINILPIPALDGGRFLFVIIEKLKGSPIKQELEQKIHTIGFVALLALIILVTIRDILQL